MIGKKIDPTKDPREEKRPRFHCVVIARVGRPEIQREINEIIRNLKPKKIVSQSQSTGDDAVVVVTIIFELFD
jgi:hypothetical protein